MAQAGSHVTAVNWGRLKLGSKVQQGKVGSPLQVVW